MKSNFVGYIIKKGGLIKKLLVDPSYTGGTGLMNPSVYVDENKKIYVNIRHVNYTLYSSENNNHEHHWGPLVYLHPENDWRLITQNYFAFLDENLEILNVKKIDTSKLDKKPLWEFVNLEDARIVRWNGKFYITGVRRDVDTIGTGRMELSELSISNENVKEISRMRIPVPNQIGDGGSYCEKNWMPIMDNPFQYVKWTNPTEVIEFNPENNQTKTVFLSKNTENIKYDLRGGSQVISYGDGYLAINHITYLTKSAAGRKFGNYKHQFTYWDKNWNVIKRSKVFTFLDGRVEFCCGLAKYENDYLITFGFQDNAAYILKISEKALGEFLYE